MQSRDCAAILRNLEIGTQFQDSENAQRNLEIAQIPKLRGTYTYVAKGLYELKNLAGKVVKKKANACRLKPYCEREKSEAPNCKQTHPDSPPVSPPPNKRRKADNERKAQKKCHE